MNTHTLSIFKDPNNSNHLPYSHHECVVVPADKTPYNILQYRFCE